MAIQLNVPFKDKDIVKELGGWWVPDGKIWVIPDNVQDIQPFVKWIPYTEGMIVRKPYMLATSKRTCWKCNKITPVAALGAKKYNVWEQSTGWNYDEEPILLHSVMNLDVTVLEKIQKIYPFFQFTFSNTLQSSYYANTCVHCKSLQGDHYLHEEENNPFAPTTFEKADMINIHMLEISYDYHIVCDSTVGDILDIFY